MRHRIKVGFVVSGQGPKWPATGRDLLAHEPVFRATLEDFDRLIAEHAAWSLIELMSSDGTDPALHSTNIGQPAHFAIQVGLARLWQSWGVHPHAVVGHSMGEIAAAHIAGAVNLRDAVAIVHHRATLTEQGAGLGRMAWVDLRPQECSVRLESWRGRLSICAHNEPLNCVVAGETEPLLAFLDTLRTQGVETVLLNFNYGFHSPVMSRFTPQLVSALRHVRPSPTRLIFASTVEGGLLSGTALDAEYWGRNIVETVRFVEAIDALIDAGCECLLELGPHSLLTDSIRACVTYRGSELPVYYSLRKTRNDLEELNRTRGALRRADATSTS